MSDEQALKAFLKEARERASNAVGEPHLSADIKTVIKDLLQVADSFSALMQQSQGQSADVRVLRKKLDQAKSELNSGGPTMAAVRKILPTLIEDLKQISVEAVLIAKRHDTSAQDPDFQSAAKIRAATQRIVALLVQLGT